MSDYIHFTEEQKAQVRQTDLVEMLRSQGETLKRSGKEYKWQDGFQKVAVRGNLWFHQYERVRGDAIDREILPAFVQEGLIYESADYHNFVFV